MDLEVSILWQRDGLMVANKPPGLPSTGRSLDDPFCLQARLVARCGRMVWAVHQLDQDTSGAILFVTRKALVREASRLLEPPHGEKIYLAICHGEPTFEERWIDAPIGRVPTPHGSRLAIMPQGKSARSRVRVLQRSHGFSLLELSLHTGRTHQARLHLSHVGLPLVGERRYRDPPCSLHFRHALHAARLTLSCSPRPVAIQAPLPEDLVRLAARVGLDPSAVSSDRTIGR